MASSDDVLLEIIVAKLDASENKIDELTETVTKHITAEESFWDAAFVNKDPRGHHDWHAKRIESEKDNKDLWKVIRNWAVLAGLGLATATVGSYIVSGFWADAQKRIVEQKK